MIRWHYLMYLHRQYAGYMSPSSFGTLVKLWGISQEYGVAVTNIARHYKSILGTMKHDVDTFAKQPNAPSPISIADVWISIWSSGTKCSDVFKGL
jgi:hypothetical protein